MKTPILHIDRCPMFRDGLGRLLADTDFDIVWEGDSWDVGREQVIRLQPKLVVLDFAGCEKESCAFMRWLRTAKPDIRIVVLSDKAAPLFLWAVLHDVDGYLGKDMSLEAIKHALSLVRAGQRTFPRHLARTVFGSRQNGPGREHGLSLREVEILSFLRAGFSNKEIASTMAIKEGTVKVHLKGVLRKVRVHNRTQAAVWAIDNNIG